jgi:hypothetical protein
VEAEDAFPVGVGDDLPQVHPAREQAQGPQRRLGGLDFALVRRTRRAERRLEAGNAEDRDPDRAS